MEREAERSHWRQHQRQSAVRAAGTRSESQPNTGTPALLLSSKLPIPGSQSGHRGDESRGFSAWNGPMLLWDAGCVLREGGSLRNQAWPAWRWHEPGHLGEAKQQAAPCPLGAYHSPCPAVSDPHRHSEHKTRAHLGGL